MNHRIITCAHRLWIALLLVSGLEAATVRVLVLPFEDKVRMKEAWDLSVDVPRWYSGTIDTIGDRDSVIACVPFDSVLALIKRNGWTRAQYMTDAVLVRVCSAFNADFAVTGSVKTFKVIKRAVNTDGDFSASHSMGNAAVGEGGATVMAGLQSYTATVKMTVALHDGRSARVIETMHFDSEEKDGGIKVWLLTQIDNDEMNFYHMGRSPFGSVYFNKSVPGALMKHFSGRLHERILSEIPAISSQPVKAPEFLEGMVLERVGADVYVNLGTADNLIQGELLEVLKRDRPALNEAGDTLGWIEVPAGTVRVRALKSHHFLQATVVDETAAIETGMTVRVKMSGGK